MSLVLSRRPGESIIIGDDVVVTITHITGNHVRVLIEAPLEIKVDRLELRQRKLANPRNRRYSP